MQVEVRTLADGVTIPVYATAGSAAVDLRAHIDKTIELMPGQRVLVPTGISVNMADAGVVALVASRSGLALKHGIQVHAGVIDSDYTGEIGVLVFNFGQDTFTINNGDRIAQLLFQPVIQVNFKQVESFSNSTERGAAGFGSTGTR